MKVFIIIFSIIPFLSFSQKRVKERREVYYTVLKNKTGEEKKRIKNYIDNIIKYDSLGNKTEFIWYGEVSHTYNNGSTGCSWNYKNIKSVTKYFYNNGKLARYSTYYYKENKVDYLYSSRKYIYDSTGFLVREEEYNEKQEIQEVRLHVYLEGRVIRETEIKKDLYSSASVMDTTRIDFSYDEKGRLIKEQTKTKSFSWRREYSYDDKQKIKLKYYFNGDQKYPFAIDYTELNDKEKPRKIEKLGFGSSSLSSSTTSILYNSAGLVSSEEEIADYERCNTSEPQRLTIYEYSYY